MSWSNLIGIEISLNITSEVDIGSAGVKASVFILSSFECGEKCFSSMHRNSVFVYILDSLVWFSFSQLKMEFNKDLFLVSIVTIGMSIWYLVLRIVFRLLKYIYCLRLTDKSFSSSVNITINNGCD